MWGALLGGALSAGGGLLGNLLGQGDRDAASALMDKDYEMWEKWNPEEFRAAILQSGAAGARGDDEANNYERMAIQEMAKRASGRDPMARAAMAGHLADAGAYERGSREAALSRLNPNSGAAIAARMMAGQQAANRANLGGLQAAGMEDSARRQALQAMAGMASGRDNRMFGQRYQTGAANDAMSQFNENNRFRSYGANTNTQLAKMQGLSRAAQNNANVKTGQAAQTGQIWAGVGEGAGNIANAAISSYGGGQQQQQQPQNYGGAMATYDDPYKRRY